MMDEDKLVRLHTRSRPATNLIDMIGRCFGCLTVITQAGHNRQGQALWRCKCDCGGPETVAIGNSLRKGHMPRLSCSCLKRVKVTEKDHVTDIPRHRNIGRSTTPRSGVKTHKNPYGTITAYSSRSHRSWNSPGTRRPTGRNDSGSNRQLRAL